MAPSSRAVFLHTGWRSCGTWIWARFRENPDVRAFYEPLHEDLDHITRRDIGLFRPNSWKSGHSSTAAYFAEYETLLGASGRGVKLYRRNFAFDDFFMAEDAENPALEAYLRGLLAAAHAEGRVPVLKFCRSLGRLAWLRRKFPEAAHLTVMRDPGAQWQSARQQYEKHENRYFLLAPFVILARNGAHPLVADALARLDLPLPPRFGRALDMTVDACWRHVQRLDWNDRYRGFLAFWTASALAALQADSLVIDATALGADSAYRHAVAAEIATRSGLKLTLEHEAGGPPPGVASPKLTPATADMALANHAAVRFVHAHRHTLPADNAAFLVRKLDETPGVDALMKLHNLEHLPAPRRARHAGFHTIDTAIYIFLLRLTFPLRRLHGRLDNAWEQRRTARRSFTQQTRRAIENPK